MKWSKILKALERNIKLYQTPSLTEEVVKRQLSVAQAVKNIFPEVDSVIATGFPWYLVSNSTKYVRVIEILRHISEFYEGAKALYPSNYDYSLIEEYAKNSNGKTIVEYFKGRSEPLLPHAIFETLMDYDFFFVVDGNPEKIAPKLWKFLRKMNLIPVEADPLRIIKKYPSVAPLDANVISTDQLYSYLEKFSSIRDITWIEQVQQSLIDWGRPVVRNWYFGIDMVTEFTELLLSRETAKRLASARVRFKRCHPFESVLLDLTEYSSMFDDDHVSRKARLIEDPFIRTSIRQRYKVLFEGRSATEWFEKFYVSGEEVFGERVSMLSFLNKPVERHLAYLVSLPELPAETDILKKVLPLAIFSLIPSVRHEAVKVLIRFENNTNYSFRDVFKYLDDTEHSHHIKEILREQSLKSVQKSARYSFLSREYLRTISEMSGDVVSELFRKKYNNMVNPKAVSSINAIMNAYEKLESYKGGYSFNTFLEDIIRVSKLNGSLPPKLRKEILASSAVHESVKKYLRGR